MTCTPPEYEMTACQLPVADRMTPARGDAEKFPGHGWVRARGVGRYQAGEHVKYNHS